MPFTPESARAARARVSPETARRQAAARWTPDARVREAIRVLVDNAPALTPEQLARLRGIVAPAVAEVAEGKRERAA